MDCFKACSTSIIANEVSATYMLLCYNTSMAYIFYYYTTNSIRIWQNFKNCILCTLFVLWIIINELIVVLLTSYSVGCGNWLLESF